MKRDEPAAHAFQRAVEGGEAARVRELFEAHPRLSDVVDEPWFTFDSPAIVYAAGAVDLAMVETLLDVGANPEARSEWGAGPYSALQRCVDGATPESLVLAERLIERGASIDLHSAAGLGRLDVLADILDRDPFRVSEPGPDGATPLHLARSPEVAALLLERGAEIEKRCVDHNSTPLMWSVQGPESVTRFLVARGAKPDLFIAAVLDDPELAVGILEAEPEALDVSVRYGKSHEHLGFGDKYVWALDFADTPLEVARRRGHEKVYRFLLDRSPAAVRLVQACRRDDPAVVEEILDGEPDLLARLSAPDVRETLSGSARTARILLQRGADPDARDEDPEATALHYAAWRGDRELVDVLLDLGANASLRDGRYASTPMGWAHEKGHEDLVEMFAERVPLDILDASWYGDMERVRVLLEGDPSLARGPNEKRTSPLRTAAWHGQVGVVRLLLDHGADPRVANEETGQTALDHAVARGHDEVVHLIRDHVR